MTRTLLFAMLTLCTSIARAEEAVPPATRAHPAYKLPEGAAFTELEVRIPRPGDFTQMQVKEDAKQAPEPDFEIAGTLNVPAAARGAGPFPAVFFISGSGTQDRHGFTPGAKSGTVGLDCGTWEILDAVADAGFVVLRVDDRAAGATPVGFKGVKPGEIGYQAIVSDARFCLRWLRERPEVDKSRVFLIGHSEGGITAPLLAGEDGAGVAGVVCMAGCGRNFYDVIYDQVEAAARDMSALQRASTLRSQRELMDATRDGREPDFEVVPKAVWNRPDVVAGRKWMREHFTLDLAALHKKVSCPALVLNGESDMQVSPEKDARRLAAEILAGASRDVTLRLYPDLDHLFKACGGRPSTLAMYAEKRPADPRFLSDLLAWLKQHAE
ncbi:MAG: alpha/beta fold hydrolase [Planctomycetes bacterium]|nr:alpha/beta fold hydrolase [Planctomycetota bacterium]